VAGLSPRPVLTLVVAETLRAGWPRGAAVSMGPLLAGAYQQLLEVTALILAVYGGLLLNRALQVDAKR
jgi:hypothetical protein